MNDQSSDNLRERIKRFFKIFIRLISIPLVMGIGIWAGKVIVELIINHVSEYPNLGKKFYSGSIAFGAAIILSLIKDLTQNLPTFYSYVFAKDNQKSREAFFKAFGAVFLASFALMLSIRAGTELASSKTPRALNLDLAFYQSIVPSPIDTKKSLLTVYVLYSEGAGHEAMDVDYADCKVCEDRKNCEDLEVPSVCPDRLYDGLLKGLSKALISCGGSDKGPTKVEVRGFASSSLAKDPDKLNSTYKENLKDACERVGMDDCDDCNDTLKCGEAFNLYIAEKRAENLVKKIEEIIGKNNPNIHISSPKWKDYKEMEKELNIYDTNEDGYVKPRGFLTRRSEIRVLKAPACEKEILQTQLQDE